MSFSPQTLFATLHELPQPSGYCVALSGGLDSSVLLHALGVLRERLSAPVTALHIDHGIHPDSSRWGEDCARLCAGLGIPLRQVVVALGCQKADGLEGTARKVRYQAFKEALGEGELLLSAHHRDDQVETLLLQLLRGGGVHGMAGMPLLRPLGRGYLARPLLHTTRAELLEYAQAHGLHWIEDPSNTDTRLERNFLRHELIPLLVQRRAGVGRVLARSATHFAESAALLDELAELDLARCRVDEGLAIGPLHQLSPARQRNLLRYFIRQYRLPLPDQRRLQAIQCDLLTAAADAMPLVCWPGAEVRRYRDVLYVMPPLPPVPASNWYQDWDGQGDLILPAGLGHYRLEPMPAGLRADCVQGDGLQIRLRQGGERIRLPGQTQHHSLKKLLQQAAIPPWLRDRLPLLYIHGKLAQVAGLWTDAAFADGEGGYLLTRLKGQ